MSAADTYDVLAGTIIAAHGVQGAIKVRLAAKTSLDLISTGTGVTRKPVDVWLGRAPKTKSDGASDPDNEGRFATLTQVKEMQAGSHIYLCRIQSVRDRNQAEALIGSAIFAPESRRAPLQEHEYFVDDLIGLQVIGDAGQDYGRVTSVIAQPANDVYVTDQGAMIPAVKAFVSEIDLSAKRITVIEVPGLRPEEAEEVRAANELGEEG